MEPHCCSNGRFCCHNVGSPHLSPSSCMKHSSSDSQSLEKCDCQISCRTCCGKCQNQFSSSAQAPFGQSSTVHNPSCGQHSNQGICPCNNSFRCSNLDAPKLVHSSSSSEGRYLLGYSSEKGKILHECCAGTAKQLALCTCTNICRCNKFSAPILAPICSHGEFFSVQPSTIIQHGHVRVPTVETSPNFNIVSCQHCSSTLLTCHRHASGCGCQHFHFSGPAPTPG